MSDNIPFDIQMEIIKKVPDVKSLIRFRSVSKPWKSFIDSPEFIACFGVRHTQPHRLLLRYKHNHVVKEVKYVSFVDDVTFPQQQHDFSPNVSDLVKQLRTSKVIGSSCGLWCLHGNKHWITKMVVIWNPSIRKCVDIVVPSVLTKTSKKLPHFGFGVCPSTYDPTIVVMSYYYGCLERKEMHRWQVQIFTLSSKTWKMIPTSNLPRESVRVTSSTQVATNRFIFWVACDTIAANDGVSEEKNLILSFDLITQEFKSVNLPHSLENLSPLKLSISKLRESIVVSAYTHKVNDGRIYGVWMIGEEGGVMTSFTKLFNINTRDSLVSKVLGFTMSGEPIIETTSYIAQYAKVEVYKPCSEHINDLRINGEHRSFFIFPYSETLLLVDHSDGCFISKNSRGR